MAIKHKAVVKHGDLILSDDWNLPHVIEDFTIKGRHIDNKEIGKDHIIDHVIDSDLLAEINYIDFISRTTDPTLKAGLLWFRSDLGVFRYSPDGVTAKTLAVGVWEKIAEISPTTDVTDIDVTGLDLATDKLWMFVFNWRAVNTATFANMFFNADVTETNYYRQYLVGLGTTVAAGRDNTSRIFPLPATNHDGLWTGSIVLDVTGRGRVIAKHSSAEPTSLEAGLQAMVYTIVANVTSIKIRANATNGIKAGSRFILFRKVG